MVLVTGRLDERSGWQRRVEGEVGELGIGEEKKAEHKKKISFNLQTVGIGEESVAFRIDWWSNGRIAFTEKKEVSAWEIRSTE
jgi:hypothetical protein